jgi:hypothetical protein
LSVNYGAVIAPANPALKGNFTVKTIPGIKRLNVIMDPAAEKGSSKFLHAPVSSILGIALYVQELTRTGLPWKNQRP